MRQPDFGKELTRIRNLKGMTQDELALKCNVSIRTIQRIESGIVNPRSYTVKAIGEILNFDFLTVNSLREKTIEVNEDAFEGLTPKSNSKSKQFFNLKTNTMSKVYFLSIFISLVSIGIVSRTKAKSQNVQKPQENVVVIYNSNTNKPTSDYRFKETRFTPLTKQHKYRLIHDISNHWINTDIKLDTNKTYYFIVSGLASTSSRKLSLWIGTEGKEHEFEGLPMYSVIGRIGNDIPFYIGTHAEVKPTKNELFYLGYNDDMFSDNIGYYIVDIFEGTEKEILSKLKKEDVEIGKYYYE